MEKNIGERYKYKTKNNLKFMSSKQLEFKAEFEKIITKEAMRNLSCSICDNVEFEIISEIDRYGFYYPTGVCKSCGHVQQINYYKKEYIDLFYQSFNQIIYRNDIKPEEHFRKSLNKSDTYYKLLIDYKKILMKF